MPCAATMTAQGSPAVEGQVETPSRAPSNEIAWSVASCGPPNPAGGVSAPWRSMGAQAASRNSRETRTRRCILRRDYGERALTLREGDLMSAGFPRDRQPHAPDALEGV